MSLQGLCRATMGGHQLGCKCQPLGLQKGPAAQQYRCSFKHRGEDPASKAHGKATYLHAGSHSFARCGDGISNQLYADATHAITLRSLACTVALLTPRFAPPQDQDTGCHLPATSPCSGRWVNVQSAFMTAPVLTLTIVVWSRTLATDKVRCGTDPQLLHNLDLSATPHHNTRGLAAGCTPALCRAGDEPAAAHALLFLLLCVTPSRAARSSKLTVCRGPQQAGACDEPLTACICRALRAYRCCSQPPASAWRWAITGPWRCTSWRPQVVCWCCRR